MNDDAPQDDALDHRLCLRNIRLDDFDDIMDRVYRGWGAVGR